MSEPSSVTKPEAARPQLLDAAALARQARRLAAADAPPWLNQEVAVRMAERLAVIKLKPHKLLQWSAFLGVSSEALAQAYPEAEQLWAEPTPELLARSQAAAKRGWFARLRGQRAARVVSPSEVPNAEVQLVWANMALHAHAEPPALLAAWHAALAVDGFLMFSCLGPDSFVELRAIYARQGWGRPAPAWWDMHDIGDLLVGAGFADPVMDQERITLTWGDGESLLRDLRALGGNLAPDRFAGLRGRAWRRALVQALEQGLRQPDGRLALTLELVHGHAFKPVPKLRMQAEAQLSVDDMRQMLRKTRPE